MFRAAENIGPGNYVCSCRCYLVNTNLFTLLTYCDIMKDHGCLSLRDSAVHRKTSKYALDSSYY